MFADSSQQDEKNDIQPTIISHVTDRVISTDANSSDSGRFEVADHTKDKKSKTFHRLNIIHILFQTTSFQNKQRIL